MAWSGPLLLRRNLLTLLFPGSDVIVFLSSGLYTWSRWKAPSSRLIAVAPFILIWIASLMRLVNGLESLSSIFAPSQSTTWFCCAMWSVMADLWTSDVESFLFALVTLRLAMVSASFWCCFNRTPNWRPFRQYMTCRRSYKVCHIPHHYFALYLFCLWDGWGGFWV